MCADYLIFSMNKISHNHILFFLSFLFFVSFFACKDDYDSYSTDSNQVLAFSTDTLSFDTLLSTVGSATKKFMVYNHHSKPLLISSVSVSGNNGFRINVDGQRGREFSNIRIGAKDSLYIFVEVTLKEGMNKEPILATDEVLFKTNNVEQKVILEAFNQHVTVLKSKIFETSTTLSNEKPYLIYDSLVIAPDATLNIPEGVILYMYSKSFIKVYGNIKVKGTLDAPVVFRGYRTDYLIDIPYDLVPGQWGGIFFSSSSYNNEFEYVHIRNGMYAMNFEPADPGISKSKIKNSILTNVNGNLLSAENCNIEIENSELSNASGALIVLSGGKYSFIHCTLANYLPGWNGMTVSGKTAVITNYKKEKENTIPLPLIQADFFNTIIYGNNSSGSNILLAKDTIVNPDTPFNYNFQYSLIKTNDKFDKGKTTECIFNKDPEFTKSIAGDDFVYDFRLDSISPARNKAGSDISAHLPFDMNDIYRFNDEGPDMGSYEWIPQNDFK